MSRRRTRSGAFIASPRNLCETSLRNRARLSPPQPIASGGFMQRRPATSDKSRLIAVGLTALVFALAGGASESWGQPANPSPFVAAGSLPASDRVALDGDTAVLVQSSVAFVFVRFSDEGPGTFSHTATLTPADGG